MSDEAINVVIHFDGTNTLVAENVSQSLNAAAARMAAIGSFARDSGRALQLMQGQVNSVAQAIQGRLYNAVTLAQRGFDGLYSIAQRLVRVGFATFAAEIGLVGVALTKLARQFIDVNQQFTGLEITLKSAFGSIRTAQNLREEIVRTTARSPIPFEGLANAARTFSVIPFSRAQIAQDTANGRTGADSFFSRGVALLEKMIAYRPDKTIDDAVFSLREALIGSFRSMQLRMGVPMAGLASYDGGKPTKELSKDPKATFEALEKFFNNIISPEAVQEMVKQPQYLFRNIVEQVLRVPLLRIGESGFYNTFLDFFYSVLQKVTAFVSDAGESSGIMPYAKRISDALQKSFGTVISTAGGGLDTLLSHLGFGKKDLPGEGTVERTFAAITKGIEAFADALPSLIKRAQEFLSAVVPALLKLGEIAAKLVDVFAKVTNVNPLLGFGAYALFSNLGPMLSSAMGTIGRKLSDTIAMSAAEGMAKAVSGQSNYYSGISRAASFSGSSRGGGAMGRLFGPRLASAAGMNEGASLWDILGLTSAGRGASASAAPEGFNLASMIEEHPSGGYRLRQNAVSYLSAGELSRLGISRSFAPGSKAQPRIATGIAEDVLESGGILGARQGLGGAVKGAATGVLEGLSALAAEAAPFAVAVGVFAAGAAIFQRVSEEMEKKRTGAVAIAISDSNRKLPDDRLNQMAAQALHDSKAYSDAISEEQRRRDVEGRPRAGATPTSISLNPLTGQAEVTGNPFGVSSEDMDTPAKNLQDDISKWLKYKDDLEKGVIKDSAEVAKATFERLGKKIEDDSFKLNSEKSILRNMLRAELQPADVRIPSENESAAAGRIDKIIADFKDPLKNIAGAAPALGNIFSQGKTLSGFLDIPELDSVNKKSKDAIDPLHDTVDQLQKISTAVQVRRQVQDAISQYDLTFGGEDSGSQSDYITKIESARKKVLAELQNNPEASKSADSFLSNLEDRVKSGEMIADFNSLLNKWVSDSVSTSGGYTFTSVTEGLHTLVNKLQSASKFEAPQLLSSADKMFSELSDILGIPASQFDEVRKQLANISNDPSLTGDAVALNKLTSTMQARGIWDSIGAIMSNNLPSGSEGAQHYQGFSALASSDARTMLSQRQAELQQQRLNEGFSNVSSILGKLKSTGSSDDNGFMASEDIYKLTQAKTAFEQMGLAIPNSALQTFQLLQKDSTDPRDISNLLEKYKAFSGLLDNLIPQLVAMRNAEQSKPLYDEQGQVIFGTFGQGGDQTKINQYNQAIGSFGQLRTQMNADVKKTEGEGFAESFVGGFKDVSEQWAATAKNMTEIGHSLAQNMSNDFGTAFNNIISGTTRAGRAFQAFFVGLLRQESTALATKGFDSLVGGITSSVGGMFGSLFSKYPGNASLPDTGSGVSINPAIDYGGAGYASGGTVYGGSGTHDDVHALLTGGEYVMPKAAVSRYGTQLLDAMRSGTARTFASGGMNGPYVSPSIAMGGAGSNTNIHIEVNDNSTKTTASSDDKNSLESNQMLAKTIHAAVMHVMLGQKRNGGIIRNYASSGVNG